MSDTVPGDYVDTGMTQPPRLPPSEYRPDRRGGAGAFVYISCKADGGMARLCRRTWVRRRGPKRTNTIAHRAAHTRQIFGADDELSKLSMSNYISKYPIDIEYDIDIEIHLKK